ncbi:MAG: HisA/HisF-related TIM barrel protein [Planctomycetota bacterium]
MLMQRIIPCLDVDRGRVVKGVRFQGLRDAGDPVERARRYQAEGADELCLLDVSATHEGRASALDTVARVREVLGIPLTVGGGVRTLSDARALLEHGADKVAVNSAALARPDLLREIADTLGAQCCVIAVDAARRLAAPPGTPPPALACAPVEDTFEVITHGGRARSGVCAVEWAARATALGAGEVLLTSFDRDGTGAGYDLALLRAVRAATRAPIIASGGAGGRAEAARHGVEAFAAGADALLAATLFHDGHMTPLTLKSELARAGYAMRLGAPRTPSLAPEPTP